MVGGGFDGDWMLWIKYVTMRSLGLSQKTEIGCGVCMKRINVHNKGKEDVRSWFWEGCLGLGNVIDLKGRLFC